MAHEDVACVLDGYSINEASTNRDNYVIQLFIS